MITTINEWSLFNKKTETPEMQNKSFPFKTNPTFADVMNIAQLTYPGFQKINDFEFLIQRNGTWEKYSGGNGDVIETSDADGSFAEDVTIKSCYNAFVREYKL